MQSSAESPTKKIFSNALRSFQIRDYAYAFNLFSDAQTRHQQRVSEPDEFMSGCNYYMGRCREAQFVFDDAKSFYGRIPRESAYYEPAFQRLTALNQDSDGDGYSDAWEESEGTNAANPLSHP